MLEVLKNLPKEGCIDFDGNSVREILFHTNYDDGLAYELLVSCTNTSEVLDPDENQFKKVLWSQSNRLDEVEIEILSLKNPEGQRVVLTEIEEIEIINFLRTL